MACVSVEGVVGVLLGGRGHPGGADRGARGEVRGNEVDGGEEELRAILGELGAPVAVELGGEDRDGLVRGLAAPLEEDLLGVALGDRFEEVVERVRGLAKEAAREAVAAAERPQREAERSLMGRLGSQGRLLAHARWLSPVPGMSTTTKKPAS